MKSLTLHVSLFLAALKTTNRTAGKQSDPNASCFGDRLKDGNSKEGAGPPVCDATVEVGHTSTMYADLFLLVSHTHNLLIVFVNSFRAICRMLPRL